MHHNPGIDPATGFYPAPYSFELSDYAQRGGMLAVAVVGFTSAISVLGPMYVSRQYLGLSLRSPDISLDIR